MRPRRTIVLAIDGLRASALGAYGNTWRPTPSLDRLASQSVVYDNTFSVSNDPLHWYRAVGDADLGWRRSQLVSDDRTIAEDAATAWFDEAVVTTTPDRSRPCDEIADTALAATFSAFAEAVAAADFASDDPTLTWLHSRGFAGPWDSPRELIAELVDEDDPTPRASVTPAAGIVDRSEDPDSLFAASCRYAAQVGVLDECLGALLAAVDEASRSTAIDFVLLGLRGYALGEHGVVGFDENGPYSEWRHAPLLWRQAGQVHGHRIASLAAGREALVAAASDQPLAGRPLVLAGAERLAVRDHEWLLVGPRGAAPDGDALDDQFELYAKPDDRWEFNDVAKLKPDVVRELWGHAGDFEHDR